MKMRDDKVKLLLYCTKAKPYLEYKQIPRTLMEIDNSFEGYRCSYKRTEDDENFQCNGKIVAECNFEVEEHKETTNNWLYMSLREKIVFGNLCKKANIDELECYKYADGKPLYAIHIKNLHIFDEPRFIQDYSKNDNPYNYIENAPQNMMYAYDVKSFEDYEKYILISIQPQEMCRIANKEQTILVRKKVLKEML